MRLIINLIVIAIIGLTVGGASAWYAIRESHGLGSIRIGQWAAWPFVGGSEVDPYTGAKVTVGGAIPLGAAEGLEFETSRDQQGQPLLRQCTYMMEGSVPAAKLWTLTGYTNEGERLPQANGGRAAIVSENLLRYPNGTFGISLSSVPRAGNWMALSGEGPFKLTLRLYETPVTSSSGLVDPVMPVIRLMECPQ